MIKISRKINQETIQLRKVCYKAYNYGGFDGVDYRTKEIIHLRYEENNKLLGSGRIVFGPHLPFKHYYPEIETQIRDFEIGRTCVDPEIINPIGKYKILSELVKKTIAICILTECNRLFTGASSCNSFLYKNLVGFEQIFDPEAYPPCNEKKIYLLALNFGKEYNDRKRGIFNLSEEYILKTKNEINEIGMSQWLY